MTSVPAGIEAFVAIHLHATALGKSSKALDTQAGSGATWSQRRDDGLLIYRFPRLSRALDFTRQAYEVVRSRAGEDLETNYLRVGIECGEAPDGCAKPERIPALARAIDLAEQCHPWQALLGPAARSIAPHSLSLGFHLIDLGEIRIGYGLAAEQVAQLKVEGFPSDFPPPAGLEEVLCNIPEPPGTPIGRDLESRAIQHALLDRQLVTIVGPAGVGKSFLANWVGFTRAESYRDGAWRVDLSSVPKGGNVATEVAAALGLNSVPGKASEKVQRALFSMDALLILDNCEHLLEECRTFLEPILRECPKIRLILGSREHLGLEREFVLHLEPLGISTDPEDLESSEAVRLFLDRARRVSAEFAVGPTDLEVIAEICRRLDGLPLGIELAAAQVAHLPLNDLLDRFKHVPPQGGAPKGRHRSLERAISWSYSLLTPSEQAFFRALGLLCGPTGRALTLAAGSPEGTSEDDAKRMLARLLDASLVQVSGKAHAPRYRLLEPLREFALEELKRHGEESGASLMFANACIAWLQHIGQHMPAERLRHAQISLELPNLHAAIDYLLKEGHNEVALQFCGALAEFWVKSGPYGTASSCFKRALEAAKSSDLCELGRALNNWGILACYAGEYGASKRAIEKAIEIFKKLDDNYRHSVALQNLALTYRNDGQNEKAVECASEALDLLPRDKVGPLMLAYGNLAAYLILVRRTGEAAEYVQMAMALNEDLNRDWSWANQYSMLSQIHESEFRSPQAIDCCRTSLRWYWQAGDVQGLLCAIERVGMLRIWNGEFERAAVLIGGSRKHFERRGVGRPLQDSVRRDSAIEELIRELGLENAEALMDYGSRRDLKELYFLAIENSTKEQN